MLEDLPVCMLNIDNGSLDTEAVSGFCSVLKGILLNHFIY